MRNRWSPQGWRFGVPGSKGLPPAPPRIEENIALSGQPRGSPPAYLQTMRPADLSEDTRYTLQVLRKRGYLLAIESSSKNTRRILTQLGLGHFFDAVADGTQITKFKPDTEVFLLAASLLGVSPEQSIVIEDAKSGVQAAEAGHFRVIGIRSKENDPNSDITVKKLSDLTEIL